MKKYKNLLIPPEGILSYMFLSNFIEREYSSRDSKIIGINKTYYNNIYEIIEKAIKPPLWERICRFKLLNIFLSDYQKFKIGIWCAKKELNKIIKEEEEFETKLDFPKKFLQELENKEKITGGELSETDSVGGELSLVNYKEKFYIKNTNLE